MRTAIGVVAAAERCGTPHDATPDPPARSHGGSSSKLAHELQELNAAATLTETAVKRLAAMERSGTAADAGATGAC
jgi:hypothetical protein